MKKIFLFVAIIFLGSPLFSQTQVLFENTKVQSYILNYTNGGDQSQRIVNDMLRFISGSMNKPLFQTRIHFSVDEHSWITRSGKQVNVFVAYEQVRLSGDIFYKGFDLGDVLIPSHYSFVCALQRKNGPELKRFTISEIPFRQRNSEHKFEYNDTIANGEYQLVMISRDFNFRNQAFDQFQMRCQQIDQYYNAESEIAYCFGNLGSINTQNFRQINQSQQQVEELIIRINRVESAPFWRNLNIRSFDPINLISKLDEAKHKISDVQTNINYVRSNLHRFYFESGLQEYNSNKRNEARNDFRQSIALQPQYPQSLYYLALMDYQDGDATASMERLSKLFLQSSIDNDLYNQASQLARDVESAKISEIKRLISQQLYPSALSGLDAISSFCKKIRNYTCNDSLYILRGDVHNATYQSYLYDAQCDLSGMKFEDAVLAVNKAISYQLQNSSFIMSNDQAMLMLQKVKAEQYLALVKRGKSLNTTKDYKNAFESFNKATEIEQNFVVKKDKQLSELLHKSKLELLLIDADVAQKLVVGNNLPRAREILLTIINDQAKYQLKDNAKLTQLVEQLKQSIFSKQCVNAQLEYDGVIVTANEFVIKKDFISALETYQKAKLVADKNLDCQLNLESMTKGIEYVQNPAKFQKDLKKANQLANNRDFSGATSLYVAITNFYRENKLSEYQIELQTLSQFISQYNVDYIQWGATYLVNNQDFESTLTLLNLLKNKKVSRSKTKSIQIGLANGFALIDYKANASVNAKVKVLEYTKDDKWFKYFASQYQKQIKSFNKK